jgi:GT2 family glycosyltransferase/glycosyltransferase involved in cell wall biosynthesis
VAERAGPTGSGRSGSGRSGSRPGHERAASERPAAVRAARDWAAGRELAVVVVTYRSAAVVGDCLAALPAALEGAGSWRVLVVDNASPDDTVAVVGRVAPWAQVLPQPTNGGFAAGVNAGVAAAAGCDVLILNADVQLAAGSVRLLRDAAEQPGVGIAVPRLANATGELQPSLRRRPTVLRAVGEAVLGGSRAGRYGPLGELVLNPARYARPGRADWATGAAWLVRRACLDAVGRFDERFFLYSEETDFAVRAAAAGFALWYVPAAGAVHLGGESGTSSPLWSLLTANRVRLHRLRHGRVRAAGMRAALLFGEALRAVAGEPAGRARHRAAVAALLRLPHWPAPPGAPAAAAGPAAGAPGYVCFSAQDWWYHNRAHSDFQLMRRVAAHRKVLLINSIGLRMPLPGRSTQVLRRIGRKVRSVAMLARRPLPDVPNFIVLTPVVLPFYGTPWLRRLNAFSIRVQVRVACRLLGMADPVMVVTIPTAWDVVAPMPKRRLLCNRSDRHSEFPESDQDTIRTMEHALLRSSDVVLYVSRSLLADERRLTGDRAHFLDHGVDLAHFSARPDLPTEIARIPGPRVGFFGGLDEYLVDFDLLERVAAELPEVSLVLIGDATCSMERFEKYQNVHWLGYLPYEQIPAYGSGFDVALMPWLDNSWIRHSNPIKLKEYLALGLPVVSTDFPEVQHYAELIRIAGDPAEFVALVRTTLADRGPSSPARRRAAVLAASWEARASELMALAEGATPRAEPDRPPQPAGAPQPGQPKPGQPKPGDR